MASFRFILCGGFRARIGWMNERKIGIVISYVNIFLHALVGFLYVPLLLFYIGSSGYGLYQLIGSFIAYFSIMDFGLTAAIVSLS